VKTFRATQLHRVRTEDGRTLGKLHELRCEWRGDRAVVTHLVYGKPGLLERLGFRGQNHDVLPWFAVKQVRGAEIIVANEK
jgi:hypothetical protein